MLDIWWRLTAEEKNFLVPYDLEASQHNIAYLINKAEQWRGPDGERRKATVYEYIIDSENQNDDDEADENQSQKVETGQQDVTTHWKFFH